MLKCYYSLHKHKVYEDSLRYAVGFEGYVNNLLGVHNNILDGHLSFSEFDISGNCYFEDQYYPPLVNENPVKNTCDFNKNMIISSPNRSGKTTILKTTTINIIFTQQVGCGFYKSAKLNPYTHIHSYLNIPDTSGRDSLFQAESRRCKEIIDIINEYNDPIKYRHFCNFDELYSGTNPEEASKAGHAFLDYLNKYKNVNYILTTHYLSICKKFSKSKCVENYKMDVIVCEDGSFEYTYKLKKGISKIKGGVRVLKDMNYPDEIIKTIERYCCKPNK
jgi:DNA mismatch repair ATPase MutS